MIFYIQKVPPSVPVICVHVHIIDDEPLLDGSGSGQSGEAIKETPKGQ